MSSHIRKHGNRDRARASREGLQVYIVMKTRIVEDHATEGARRRFVVIHAGFGQDGHNDH